MDRTAEFKAAVNSLLSRGHLQNRQHFSHADNSPARRGKEAAAYAEFSRLATSIRKDLSETSNKLGKLSKLVKRKALFDDRPVEISELTYMIKQDLGRLNGQILALQQHVRATAAKANRATRQMDEHSTNLVIVLQSRLANISMGFKEALETRTESMQASKKRQDQLLQSSQSNSPQQQHAQALGMGQQQYSGQALPLPQTGVLSSLRNTSRSPMGLVPTTAPPPQHPSQYNNNSSIPQNGGRTSPFIQPPQNRSPSATAAYSQQQQQYTSGLMDVDPYNNSSMHRRKGRADEFHGQYEDDSSESAGPASMLFQQQQHAPHAEQYVQQRSTAIEAVESTLQELGGIFQQLAQMVAEQRDTVQRIEANTDDIELNINEAQNQLLRYYSNISSDRWLMIKIFLTIIFVFLVISLIS